MKYIVLLFLLISCDEKPDKSILPVEPKPEKIDIHKMHCKGSGLFDSIKRCENVEAVCYVYTSYQKGGIDCKFKEVK